MTLLPFCVVAKLSRSVVEVCVAKSFRHFKMTPFNHSTKTQVKRAFSNITKGELNRTTIEQISEQDFKRLGDDLSIISPLKIQQQHDRDSIGIFIWDRMSDKLKKQENN
jgi:hypothetical protein